MKSQDIIVEREYKEYTIHTLHLIDEIRRNISAGRSMIHYTHRYMDAALTLAMYDYGDKSFEMVDNGREHYVNQVLLWLSKAVNCLMYFQSEAKKRGRRIFDGYVHRDEYCECVDLIACVYQALMEFFHDDYANAQALDIPIEIQQAA